MSASRTFAVYDFAVSVAVHTVLAPLERLRIRTGKATAAALDERLGRWSPPSLRTAPQGRRILIHAVSVGEMAAASALINALGEIAPEISIVISTGNREGRAAAESLRRNRPAIEAVTFLPWDRNLAVREWLGRIAPDAVIVLETEIWPNFFGAARELGIPLFIANGRIYPGDVARYGLARRFFSSVLEIPTWIGVQSTRSRDAFVRIGAPADRVEVMGDLKADAPRRDAEIPDGWRDVLDADTSPLVIAVSTHHPEERVLFRTLLDLRQHIPDLRLVLAPRHPDRAPGIQRLAEKSPLSTVLWSDEPTADWDILLIDAIGPPAALVRWADVVVMGGSLTRGGHNPLEAAAAGRSMLIGPSYEHFNDLVEGLLETGGIRVLPSTDDPADAIRTALYELLADPDLRHTMGQRARDFLRSQQGVAGRYAHSVVSRISDSDQS